MRVRRMAESHGYDGVRDLTGGSGAWQSVPAVRARSQSQTQEQRKSDQMVSEHALEAG